MNTLHKKQYIGYNEWISENKENSCEYHIESDGIYLYFGTATNTGMLVDAKYFIDEDFSLETNIQESIEQYEETLCLDSINGDF